MKQLLFGIICLLVFGTIIAVGQYYNDQEVDATFAEAQKRVDTFPDLPTIDTSALIPKDLIDAELTKIRETEERVNAEAAQAAEQAQAAADKLAQQKAKEEAAKKVLEGRPIPSLGQAAETAQTTAKNASESTDDFFAEFMDDADKKTTAATNTAANTVTETTTSVTESINNVTGTATETVQAAEETVAAVPVMVKEQIQMDEDGLPIAPVKVAMANTTEAANAVTDTLGAATAVAAELPTMAARTLGPKVVVIGYHQFASGSEWGKSSHVTPESVLKRHLQIIKESGYEVIPLAQLLDSLKTGAPLPPKAAVLTIDNGFNNALKIAKPNFDEYEYPWTFFVFTKLVSTGATGATWDELLVDIQDGNFDVQSQTKSHNFLTRRKGRDDKHYAEFLQKELDDSKNTIEQRLNQPVTSLAYPFGNYNDEIIAKAQEYGYEAMFTIVPQFVDFSKGPAGMTAIPRFIVTKESADYLESFLSDHAMAATSITPRPGSVDETARPEIKLTLVPTVKLDPSTVAGSISGVSDVDVTYDEASHTVTLKPKSDLSTRAVRVQVNAKTPEGQDTGLSWYYYYGPKLMPTE